MRYALRSIELYLTGWEELYLIGDKLPDWYKGDAIYYKEEDKKLPRNILYKIQASFPRAGNTVVQWQDDIYITGPLHVKDIRYWYEGTLEEAIRKMHGRYNGMIKNTAMKITDQAKYYDVHTPIIYHNSEFEQLVKMYNWDQVNLLVKSLYCANLDEIVSESIKNIKINGPEKDIGAVVGDNLFFSTGPFGVCPDMEAYLLEKYPVPSRFENLNI